MARKVLGIALPVLTAVVLAIVAYFVIHAPAPGKATPDSAAGEAATPNTRVKFARKAHSLNDLLALPPRALAEVDIAEMNLLCAEGLPGAEDLDIDHCLATLDQRAERVKIETERHLYRAHDPRWAEHYRNSEAYLRAEFLLQVLQEDLRVKYDMTSKDNFSFRDSRVAFLHGMIPAKGKTVAQTQGGTCASMPVMYVAVGRRLGYPLKLVTTESHIFVRWDGKGNANPGWRERFNIEGTNGFSSFADDYYKTWPHKLTDAQVRANRYLVSLTPSEELAGFLAARGHCAVDNGQISFAARCYENAWRYDTARPAYRAWFLDTAMKSGYRPATPHLARLVAGRKRLAMKGGQGFDPLATPKPSETPYVSGIPTGSRVPGMPATPGVPGAAGLPNLPHYRVGPAQPPLPTATPPQTPQIPRPGFTPPHRPTLPGQPPRP